jgi:hypothetical protein
MAQIELKIVIEDVLLSKTLMEQGWVEMEKMPQVADPTWVDPGDGSKAPMVDQFNNLRKHVQSYLADHLVYVINKGLDKRDKRINFRFKRNMITG